MALDLGMLATNLGTAYLNAKYGAQPAGFTIPGTDINIEGDLPFIDVTTRRRRRRRRRLLTPTDFGDLALLKTLTGNNDAFKAAVIKAVRR